MKIFHFNCALCGATPREVMFADYLKGWEPDDGKRVEELTGQLFTAFRQLRDGMRGKRSSYIASEVEALLDLLRGGRDAADFPPQLHGYSPWSSFPCLVTCAICREEPGERQGGSYFKRWDEACKVQTANLCFEASTILAALPDHGHAADTPGGYRLDALRDGLRRFSETIGLPACPHCGRHTSCLYGPEQPYLLKGRCRWCLDANNRRPHR